VVEVPGARQAILVTLAVTVQQVKMDPRDLKVILVAIALDSTAKTEAVVNAAPEVRKVSKVCQADRSKVQLGNQVGKVTAGIKVTKVRKATMHSTQNKALQVNPVFQVRMEPEVNPVRTARTVH